MPSQSPSTKRRAPDVRPGDLPPGFVAIDVAAHLGLKLCDPDRPGIGLDGHSGYALIGAQEHPSQGNGLIGPSCVVEKPHDGKVIVAANGGTDLIYVPDGDAARIADVATFLLGQDYVDALFVGGPANAVPGALSLRDINLAGSALLPAPSIVVALKTFSRDPRDPIRSQVDVSDTTLQQGQGGHGSFGRADVTNTMIAFGPGLQTRLRRSLAGQQRRSPRHARAHPGAHSAEPRKIARPRPRRGRRGRAARGQRDVRRGGLGAEQGRAPDGAAFSDCGWRPLPRRAPRSSAARSSGATRSTVCRATCRSAIRRPPRSADGGAHGASASLASGAASAPASCGGALKSAPRLESKFRSMGGIWSHPRNSPRRSRA